MGENSIALRPTYWASVSGGKDSLYMLYVILHNLDKYPLNGVVHYEMETDYPFIADVINYMESECKKHGIPFYRLKPQFKWEELYDIKGYPTKVKRWCTYYKLSAEREFRKMLKSNGYDFMVYIGYCVDEYKRYQKRNNDRERYPLVEEGIEEKTILEWAKQQPIFNHYYQINKRCGCMGCPLSSKMELAYLYKYYPDYFEYFMSKAQDSEDKDKFNPWSTDKRYNTAYIRKIVKEKYLPRIEEIEKSFTETP